MARAADAARLALVVPALVVFAACGSSGSGSPPKPAKPASHHTTVRTRPGGNTTKGE